MLLVLKRILAVLCWLMVAGGCINLFANANAIMFPMSLALMVLFFRWGKDLWVVDPDTAHAKGWVKSLIYIGVHLGLVLVSALIGVLVSVLVAGGSPIVTNWVFLLVVFVLGLWLKPKKFLPKNKENLGMNTETPAE